MLPSMARTPDATRDHDATIFIEYCRPSPEPHRRAAVPSGLAPPPLADEGRPGHMAGPHHCWVDGMRCVACGSEAVTERAERTAQGYRRFRCRACRKQFNERSTTLL